MQATGILFILSRYSSQPPAVTPRYSSPEVATAPSLPSLEEKSLDTAADAVADKSPPVWRASCYPTQVDVQSMVLADASPAWLSLGMQPYRPEW